jgi:DNA anti-recombination protein RmuC
MFCPLAWVTMTQARTKWNDDRIDHLSGQVDSVRAQVDSLRLHMDERFERQEARIDAKFTAFEERIDAKFATLDGKFDDLQRTIILTLGGILATFGGVFLAAQL